MSYPVDTYREAAPLLRRPFTPAAVKFKVQATWPKDNPTGGLIVAYIDARLVVERLNMVIPDRWADHYEPFDRGFMWCHLTVDGITRSDIGQGEGKGLVSDALKRAAVKFGIGVSLYATPSMMLSVNDGHLKVRQTNKGKTCELTPTGEARVRQTYEKWLSSHGKQAFGEPLDHGDVLGAQGDIEAAEPEVPAEPETRVAVKTPRPKQLHAQTRKELQDLYAKSGWTTSRLREYLKACGVVGVDELTPEQAKKLRELFQGAIEEKAA